MHSWIGPQSGQSHTGMNLEVAFIGILHDFKISNKILSVTCDNASNNNRMVIEMSKRLTKISAVNHTRCFAHILNLLAKSLLKQFNTKLKHINQLNDEDGCLLALAGNIEDEDTPLLKKMTQTMVNLMMRMMKRGGR